MVFERYALYPHLKAYDNIATPLKIRGTLKADIAKRIKFFAELLEITHQLDHWPSQLSGGERLRVGIARALVREPSIFLLDEPISHLDAKLRIRMRAELKKLQRKMGITAIYVTHDQIEAMTMADKIVLMRKGTLQQIGTPEELFNKPSNLFVAKFIGEPTMNVLPCTLVKKNGQIFLEGKEYRFSISQSLMLAPRTAKTLPPATVGLLGFGGIHWAVISAAVTIMIIPLIVYLLIMQKQLVKGLTLGAV